MVWSPYSLDAPAGAAKMTVLANWRPTSLETRERLRWAYAKAQLMIAIELEKLRRQQMQEIMQGEIRPPLELEANRWIPASMTLGTPPR